jgi:LuxR family maltose regulon positive regulatory protein
MKNLSAINILNTKLQIPNLSNDYICRQYLIEYLNENIKRPLTLVSAGAGYGKSTLISSWLDLQPFKKCWFSIDEHDNDIRTFLTYFIASIRAVIPDFGSNIYRNIFSPDISSVDILTNNLINDLTDLHDELFLTLDDFHNITNLDIISLISNILKHPIEKFHIIIISRTDPPLPLHKLRAVNKVKDIRSSHLKLTKEESKTFLQSNTDIESNDQVISLINSKFEGWITGVRLLKIHLSFVDFDINKLVRFIQNSNFSETYFIEELIKQIDSKILHFLLKTSVLQKINHGLSDYILSGEDNTFNSRDIIRELLNKNLFLINLDTNNEWFRYHHLFQETLQKELNLIYKKKDIINIHKKAAVWYSKNNFYEEAFYHTTQIEDDNITAEFIRKNMYRPLNQNKWFILERWLKHIPDNIINNCPVLLTAKMWVMQHKGVYWIIPKLIDKIENIKEDNIELFESIKHQLVFFKALINFWAADVEKSLKQFDYVRNKTATDKMGVISLSAIYFATASYMMGNGDNIYKEIQFEITSGKLNVDYKIILLGAVVYMKLLGADLYAVERVVKRIADESSSLNNKFYVVWNEFFMGYIAFQQYRNEEALLHFKEALKLIYLLNTHAPLDVFAGMLLMLKTTNNDKEFEQTINQMTSFVYEWNDSAYNTVAYSLRARLAIIDNDLQKASEYFKQADMDFNFANMLFNIEVPEITYCKLLLAKEKADCITEAINKLQELLNLVTRTNNIPQTIEVLILLSVALNKKGDKQNAVAKLSEALILAEKGYFIRPFIEQAENIKSLLENVILNNENIKEFILALKKIISNTEPFPQKVISFTTEDMFGVENLSNRELDVITLLAQRFSNKEIAEQLYISPATVKKHTLTIYRKLGVNKRRDAVDRAQKLGLLS